MVSQQGCSGKLLLLVKLGCSWWALVSWPWRPQPALPFRDGEGHVLQPLLVGLWGADLGDNGAKQFVHQL